MALRDPVFTQFTLRHILNETHYIVNVLIFWENQVLIPSWLLLPPFILTQKKGLP